MKAMELSKRESLAPSFSCVSLHSSREVIAMNGIWNRLLNVENFSFLRMFYTQNRWHMDTAAGNRINSHSLSPGNPLLWETLGIANKAYSTSPNQFQGFYGEAMAVKLYSHPTLKALWFHVKHSWLPPVKNNWLLSYSGNFSFLRQRCRGGASPWVQFFWGRHRALRAAASFSVTLQLEGGWKGRNSSGIRLDFPQGAITNRCTWGAVHEIQSLSWCFGAALIWGQRDPDGGLEQIWGPCMVMESPPLPATC